MGASARRRGGATASCHNHRFHAPKTLEQSFGHGVSNDKTVALIPVCRRQIRRRVGTRSCWNRCPSDCDLGDDRKVIGHAAGAVIDEARPHRGGRPAEDAVEVKERTPGRECRMPGPARELSRQRPSQRCRPEPFVEVAEHHRSHRVRTRDRHQPACLTPSLAERPMPASQKQESKSSVGSGFFVSKPMGSTDAYVA